LKVVVADKALDQEKNIIKKCLRGNSRAQHTLYENYKVKWFMISLRYANNRAEAEDMLQEGLISIFKDLHQFDSNKASFSAWSSKVMVNASLQYLRKWKKLTFNRSIDEKDEHLPVNEDIYDNLGAKELTALVQELPDGYRTVFNLYAIEGYKHKEIAEMLSISENTSKSQLMKAKNMLRNRLEKVLQY
jgi:RNA polymerase sigma-70 factor (ECF subfamily)